MERIVAEAIASVMMEYFDEDVEIKEDYSGRFMFGETTTAIITRDPYMVYTALGLIFGFFLNNKLDELKLDGFDEEKLEELREEIDYLLYDTESGDWFRVDNFGLEFVVY